MSPTVPVYITVQVDRPLLLVGESAQVTVTVASNATEATPALDVTLDLPNDLATSDGQKNKLRWNAPPVRVGGSWQQAVTVVVDKPQPAVKAGVVALRATAHAPHHAPYRGSTLLGLAPSAPGTESLVATDGAVVRNPQGDVTLLVTPGAAAVGARFTYTEVHHWRRTGSNQQAAVSSQQVAEILTTTVALTQTQGVTGSPTVTVTGSVTVSPVVTTAVALTPTPLVTTSAVLTSTAPQPLGVALFLPAVRGGSATSAETLTAAPAELTVEITTPLTATAPLTETLPLSTPQPLASDNIDAYAIWQLAAVDGEQPVAEFSGGVQLVVSAADLAAQGVDPARLGVWTRPDASERWAWVESTYDPVTQQFSAYVPHFSEFSLAQGLSEHGSMLPSMRAFSVDRLSGAATFAYPIETPQGLGGLSPNLSLSYSSVTIDELFRKNGQDAYKTQASSVGLGWNVGGISYIARAGGSLDNGTLYQDREYVLALNGQHVRIKYEDGKWQSDPAIFAKIERPVAANTSGKDYPQWFVTTSDGVKYTFGDATVDPTTFVSTAATATYVQWQTSVYERTAKKWYLVSVEDRLGNRMSYSYTAEKGDETGCVPSNRTDLQWYTRAIYPSQITWSQNGGVGPHLRVSFSYNASDRTDYKVEKWGSNDCGLTDFATKNRLDQIDVQALVSGSWQTIRSYALGYTYSAGVTVTGKCNATNNNCKRLLLTSVQQLGKSGGGLPAYSFGYTGSMPAAIYLQSANNGFGGAITYTYLGHQPNCDAGTCGAYDVRWRQAVVRTDVADGLGNTAITTYCYGPSSLDPVTFARINGNSYCDSSTILHVCNNAQSRQTEWGAMSVAAEFLGYCRADATFYALTTTPGTLPGVIKWERTDGWIGPRGNPDPRRGRVWKQEVRSSRTNPVLSQVENFWNSYRAAHAGCTSTAGWCDAADNTSIHDEGQQKVYHINWVRLDAVSTWRDQAGSLTRHFYEASKQGGYQYGNLTEMHELSHSESNLSLSTWQSRVSGNSSLTLLRKTVTDYFPNTTLQLVSQTARVRIFGGANATTCLAQVRTTYVNGTAAPQNRYGNYQVAPNTGLPARVDTQFGGTACVDTEATPNNDPNSFYTAAWINNWAVQFFAYDAYGNQTMVRTAGNSTSKDDYLYTVYESTYNLFPRQQYKGQNTSFQENAIYYGVNESGLSGGTGVWGQIKEHCGVNSLCTQLKYDEFGRPERRWERRAQGGTGLPGDSEANVAWNYRNPGYYGSSHKTYIVTEWRSPRCYGNFTRILYNGLGQVVTEQQPYQDWSDAVEGCGTANQGQEIDVNYAYDALGNQTQASVPRLVARANFATRAADLNVATTTTYDALGRPGTITHPNGSQNYYTYSGRATAFWGKARSPDTYDKVLKRNDLDGLGHLQAIRTYTSSGAQDGVELLEHDVLGNLRTATHAGSAGSTTMEYDLRGRKTQMSDADLGTWTYAYDRQGQLTRQTDARGKTICLYYDNLGRLVGKHFRTTTACPSSVTTYDVRYTYDQNHSATNRSRGQLTYVASGDWEKWLDYNSLGLVSKEWVRYFNPTTSYFTLDFGYDNAQRPNTLTYNGNEVVTTSYNSMGLPNKLTSSVWGVLATGDTNNDKDTVDAGDGAHYDEAGRLRNLAFPGAIWRYLDYAPWGENSPRGGHLSDLWVGYYFNNNNTWYDYLYLKYTYDSFGNIKSLQEVYNEGTPTTETYAYDAQNRLTTGPGHNYSYDSAGRLTSYDGATVGVDNTFPTHGLKSMGSMNLNFYDANGNRTWRLTSGNGGSWHYLLWDHENRLQEVDSFVNGQIGPALERYAYDADGQRVKKEAGGVATYYPSQFYEQSGSTVTKYYYFNGQRIAQSQNNALTFLHSDHLGSVRYLTNSGGSQIGDRKYFAYGRQRSGSPTFAADHRFTGQKEDATGLYYYNARYYDPQLGQFLSPDTLVPDPTELIDYNRYAYAKANPLKYNDPSGHQTSKCVGEVAPPCDSNHGNANGNTGGRIGGGGVLDVEQMNVPSPTSAATGSWWSRAWNWVTGPFRGSTATSSTTPPPVATSVAGNPGSGSGITGDSLDASYLRSLPQRPGNKGPTTGTLIVNGQEYSVKSGRGGLASKMPKGAEGFTGPVREHAEGEAAARMHRLGAMNTDATLYINNSAGPCPACDYNLGSALPGGSTLRVVWGDMFGITDKVFGPK